MEDQMRQLFENLAVRLEGGPGGADGQQRQEQEAAARLLATEAREKVKALIKQTNEVDGTDKIKLRRWIKDVQLGSVDLANNARTIELVSRTVNGALRDEIEHFIATSTASARWCPME
jgi:hypothetical protein